MPGFTSSSRIFSKVLSIFSQASTVLRPPSFAFAASAPDGIPGSELFWEHLHPNQAGYHLIGKTFFEALAQANFLGRPADPSRLRSWSAYSAGMELTESAREIAIEAGQKLRQTSRDSVMRCS